MESRHITKQFKWLDDWFKVTKYFGSNVIEIQVLKNRGWRGWLRDPSWERIYFGHTGPLEECIEFFKNN